MESFMNLDDYVVSSTFEIDPNEGLSQSILHRKINLQGNTYVRVHFETDSQMVVRPNGQIMELYLTQVDNALNINLTEVQSDDNVPVNKNGKLVIGTTKNYINGKVVSMDGHKHPISDITAFPSYSVADSGKALSVASDGTLTWVTYLPLAGGTVTGKIKVSTSVADENLQLITKKYVDDALAAVTPVPYIASSTAPTNTKVFWIDTTNGYILKFYDTSTTTWKNVNFVWGA